MIVDVSLNPESEIPISFLDYLDSLVSRALKIELCSQRFQPVPIATPRSPQIADVRSV